MRHLKFVLLLVLAACASNSSAVTVAEPRRGYRAGVPQSRTQSAVDEFIAAHGEYYSRSILHPLVDLSVASAPGGGIDGNPLAVDVSGLALDAILTPPLDRDSFLIVGGLAEVRQFRFDGVPAVADETLYGFALRLGYGTFLGEDLTVQAYWEPSLYSDLDGTLNADDYQLGNGVVLAYLRQNADLFFKFGVASTEASDAGFAPVVGAVWHIDEHWILDVLLPVTLDLHLRPNEQWDLTAGAHLRANRYQVRAPARVGALENDIDLSEIVAFVAARRRLSAHLSTELEVGSIVGGTYELGYGNGRPDQGGTLQPSLFVRWRVSWGF
jgi:hypothetical protein